MEERNVRKVRKVSSRIIEGSWNCDRCGNKEIKARYDACPSCGNRRNYNTKYEMLDKNNYVSDEVAAKIDKRPDWLCSYCNNLNRANFYSCASCGASKEDSKKNYFENLEEKEQEENGKEELYSGKNNSDNCSDNNRNDIVTNIIRKINKNKGLILGCTLIPLIIFLVVLLFIPKTDTITVESFYWESNLNIEEYKAVDESDWSLPSGARLQHKKQEISHYDKVFDHYETRTKTVTKERFVGYEEEVKYKDLGNGYFEEVVYQVPKYETYQELEEYTEAVYVNVPIYRTKYYYEIDKWVFKETIKASNKDKDPYYPDVKLKEKERISSKKQEYFVTGKSSENKRYTVSVSKDKFDKLNLNDKLEVKIYLGGIVQEIE